MINFTLNITNQIDLVLIRIKTAFSDLIEKTKNVFSGEISLERKALLLKILDEHDVEKLYEKKIKILTDLQKKGVAKPIDTLTLQNHLLDLKYNREAHALVAKRIQDFFLMQIEIDNLSN